jgi:hypothetical protein
MERLGLVDDVARLHVKIDKLNDPLVGFCFIRDIDENYDGVINSSRHISTPEKFLHCSGDILLKNPQ